MRLLLADRAASVELKDGIIASVTVAGGSNDLVASTDKRNPDTLFGLVITITPRFSSKDGVILQAVWELATVDEVSILASSMSAWSLFIEINMVVASRVIGIGGSDEDVVSLAVLDRESGIDTSLTRAGGNISNATHLVTIIVDLDLGIKHVELVASGSSDTLLLTIVSVAVPATTTLGLRTIAALLASLNAGAVADENIREAVDILSVPALSVLCFFIRHDGKREGHTLDGRRNGRNSNEVTIASGKEHNLCTKTTIIIIVSNACTTRARVRRRGLGFTLRIDFDERIVYSRGAGASCDDNLAVGTLHAEEHRVLKILLTTVRECGLEVISATIEVVGKSSDHDRLIAVAVRVHRALLDGKSETTTGVAETSDKDPIILTIGSSPADDRLAIASIIVVSDTLAGTFVGIALTVNSNDRIVVCILVAGMGDNRSASASDLVPKTRAVSVQARIVDSKASTSLTHNRVRVADGGSDLSGIVADGVIGWLNLRGSKVVDTSGVQETSNKDVVSVH